MEKRNLKANNFDKDNEIKNDSGIIDSLIQPTEEPVNLELLAKEKNLQEALRLKNETKIKQGDRINYFMVDLDERLREISFKFPATKLIIELSEYGISSDGRLFLDLTKSVDLLIKNNLFINKFDIDEWFSKIGEIYRNHVDRCSTTISKESTSQVNGDGSAELLTAA